jgi:hypothetical protein
MIAMPCNSIIIVTMHFVITVYACGICRKEHSPIAIIYTVDARRNVVSNELDQPILLPN